MARKKKTKAKKPPSDSSTLMDKVPAELRLKIFGIVLQSEHGRISLDRTVSSAPRHVLMDLSSTIGSELG